MTTLVLAALTVTVGVVRAAPNIIFVMSDDTGWHGVGWHQSAQCRSDPNCAVLTPHMDKLVSKGLELDHHYTYQFCSPTRSSLLTGRYPLHVNQQNNAAWAWTAAAIHPNFTTIADVLRDQAGYATHHIGKWHLGLGQQAHTPAGRGFDTSLGYLSGSEEHFTHAKGATACKANCTGKCATDLWETRNEWRTIAFNEHTSCNSGADDLILTNTKAQTEATCKAACSAHPECNVAFHITDPSTLSRCLLLRHCSGMRSTTYSGSTYLAPTFGSPAIGYDGVYSTELYANRLIEIIEDAAATPVISRKPFFVYLAFAATHEPIEAPQRFIDLYPESLKPAERRTLFAMTSALDEAMQNITEALQRTSLWEETLLVWASDNGGPTGVGMSPPQSLENCANNHPLRGGKGSDFQGGVRTVGFVTGGVLPERMHGKKASGYIHVADWFATFTSLASIDAASAVAKTELNGMPCLDSLNMWPYLSGSQSKSSRLEFPLSLRINAAAAREQFKIRGGAIISGDFKAIFGEQGHQGLHTEEIYPTSTSRPAKDDLGCPNAKGGCLFNITADPEERNDIADDFPEELNKLRSRLLDYVVFQSDSQPDNEGVYDCNGCFTQVHGQYSSATGRAWFGPWIDSEGPRLMV